jgi:hypothetical protein
VRTKEASGGLKSVTEQFDQDADYVSPASQRLAYPMVFYDLDGDLDASPREDFYAAAEAIVGRLARRETVAEIEGLAADVTLNDVTGVWDTRTTNDDKFAHLLMRWVNKGVLTSFAALDVPQQEALLLLLEKAAEQGMTADQFYKAGENITFNNNANARRKVLTDDFNGGTGVKRVRRMSDDDFSRRAKPDVTNPLTRGLSRWKDGEPVEYITQRADFTVTDDEGETYDNPEIANAPTVARGAVADVEAIGRYKYAEAIAAGASNAEAVKAADAAETAAIADGKAEYKSTRAVPLQYHALMHGLVPELNGVDWDDIWDIAVKKSELTDAVLLTYLRYSPALTYKQIAAQMSIGEKTVAAGALRKRKHDLDERIQKKQGMYLAALAKDDPALCWQYERDKHIRELEAKQEARYVQHTSLPTFTTEADACTVCPCPCAVAEQPKYRGFIWPSTPLVTDPDAPYHTWFASDLAHSKGLDAVADIIGNAADIAGVNALASMSKTDAADYESAFGVDDVSAQTAQDALRSRTSATRTRRNARGHIRGRFLVQTCPACRKAFIGLRGAKHHCPAPRQKLATPPPVPAGEVQRLCEWPAHAMYGPSFCKWPWPSRCRRHPVQAVAAPAAELLPAAAD